jgi:hypothetical protein
MRDLHDSCIQMNIRKRKKDVYVDVSSFIMEADVILTVPDQAGDLSSRVQPVSSHLGGKRKIRGPSLSSNPDRTNGSGAFSSMC